MLNRLSIAQKIYGAFGALVLLLAALCVAGVLGVSAVASIFADYRGAAAQTQVLHEVNQTIDEARYEVLAYLNAPDEAKGQAVLAQLGSIDLAAPEVAGAFAGDAGAEASLAETGTQLEAYRAGFAQVTGLFGERDQLISGMQQELQDAFGNVGTLADMAASVYHMDAILVSTHLSASLLQMSGAADRYFRSGADADLATIMSEGAKAGGELTELGKALTSVEGQAIVDATRASVAAYLQQAERISTVFAALNEVQASGMGVAEEAVRQALASLNQTIVGRQNELGPAGEQQAAMTLTIMLVVGGFALVAGIAMAIAIGMWLSGAIRAVASNMRRLAEGDLDIEIDTARQRHELGQMAEALEVFRTNGRQVRTLDAQKAEAVRIEAEERAARDELQAEMARVVASAVAGDFSARIAQNGRAPDLQALADSLNLVMETVERGVTETGAVLDALAAADLSKRMRGEFAGAFGQLKNSTNTAADAFADILRKLQETSRALKTATGEILSGANDLSERTTRQAATIEETSAAMEQLAGTVTTTAAKAEEAAERTQQASNMADEGGRAMNEATEAMERITTSSSKISNIIGLIDDIAFQTNLLALNASVEAARAGEAGKGFAVVAVEVRRLAQSAAEASSEVKVLIEQSANEVKGGSKRVADAAQKLTDILGAVRENTQLIGVISTATREQSAAIGEVSMSIRQLDEMTQHNAALVEQTNAAIEQTEAQASALDEIVDAFVVDAAEDDDDAPVTSRQRQPDPGHAPRRDTRQRAPAVAGNMALAEDWSTF